MLMQTDGNQLQVFGESQEQKAGAPSDDPMQPSSLRTLSRASGVIDQRIAQHRR